MVVAAQDDAYNHGKSYIKVLRRIGLRKRHFKFGYRGSLVIVGYVGRRQNWVKQVSHKRRRGPSVIRTRILRTGKHIFCSFFVILY